VLTLDVGQVTNGSAGQWLSGTLLGAVSEYTRRTAAERPGEAQARAVARGVAPWPNVPRGYLRGDDGRLRPDPATACVVAAAFRMRADCATVADVRTFLAGHANHGSYPLYRCPPTGSCTQRVTISAELVEELVVDHVRDALSDVDGRASVEDNAREADAALERAQQNLEGGLHAFARI
jgi:hypothetical protein